MLPDPIFWRVHMYGVMIAVGLLANFLVLYGYGKKTAMHTDFLDFIFYNAIASIVLGFGAAALFQALYNYIEDPAGGFHFGGITFLGGLVGGVATFLLGYFLFRRRLHGTMRQILNIAPCCITIAHAFGRVGCFFAGCCYGKETDSVLGIKFPRLPRPVYPTQLYEAVFLFLLFGVLSYLLLKKKFRYNMPVYLFAYGAFRFVLEFLRGDHRGQFFGVISPSQFWSLAFILIGAVMLYLLKRLYRVSPSALPAEDLPLPDDLSENKSK